METAAVTLANPIAVGFWFTIGCTLAGVVGFVTLAVVAAIIRALLG